MFHRSAYDPEDPVNDYTGQTPGSVQDTFKEFPVTALVPVLVLVLEILQQRPHEEAYESIPGALRSHPPQQHIMVDDEDDDYDDDAGSRRALLGRNKSYYADSVSSSQSTGAQSYRSRKSRKSSRVSRKSSRAGTSSSGSSFMSSSSWSSTASGRWKEKETC